MDKRKEKIKTEITYYDLPDGTVIEEIKRCPYFETGLYIYDGVCDMPDICKKTDCEYYNITKEARRRHLTAIGWIAAFPCYRRKER